jgi:uncharacterized protein (DUF1501 family)
MKSIHHDRQIPAQPGRREWLRRCGALMAGGMALGPLAGLAGGRGNGGYKALVCIELAGGNDGLNTITAIDDSRYAQYSTVRGPLALPQSALLPLNGDYGLHPALSALIPLWQQKKLATLFNVGPLHQPLTQAEYISLPEGSPEIPGNLFSHADQLACWESSTSDPLTRSGWGGRASAVLNTANPVISLGGNTLFGVESLRTPLVLPFAGAYFGATGLMSQDLGDPGNRLRRTAMDALHAQPQNVDLADAYTAIHNYAFVVAERLGALVGSVPGDKLSVPAIDEAFAPLFNKEGLPGTFTAAQLYQVAKLIKGRAIVLGNRQLFYVRLGGFDSHSNQLDPANPTQGMQAALLQELGDAMAAFQGAMDNINMSEQVTTFTQADFGRTFLPNTSLGTDHAWGNQHFILGGAVNGGKTYGTYPTLVLGGQDDVSDDPNNSQGRFIPTTSVDEYARTLLHWFGLNGDQIATVLPNIGNFPPGRLGFL